MTERLALAGSVDPARASRYHEVFRDAGDDDIVPGGEPPAPGQEDEP